MDKASRMWGAEKHAEYHLREQRVIVSRFIQPFGE